MGKGSSNRMPSAARKAMGRNEAREQETYDYLLQGEQLPMGVRQGALGMLAGNYGIQQPEGYEGQWGSQQGMIDQARQSPLYSAIMGTQEAGEESIMRNAAMTGGFRSGNMKSNFMDFNQRLEEQALLQSYGMQLQGLGNLAQTQPMPSMLSARLGPTAIPGSMQQQSTQGAWMGGIQQLIGSGGGMGKGGAFGPVPIKSSDSRLKTRINKIGENKGLNIYTWTWNDIASNLYNLVGNSVGYIAQEVKEKFPEAVSTDGSGYLQIDYGRI